LKFFSFIHQHISTAAKPCQKYHYILVPFLTEEPWRTMRRKMVIHNHLLRLIVVFAVYLMAAFVCWPQIDFKFISQSRPVGRQI